MASDNTYDSKVTANIDNATHNIVTSHFHYGQQTIFFRRVFDSLRKLIETGKFNEITDYLYKESDLILPGKVKK